jgi:hypothetical protein
MYCVDMWHMIHVSMGKSGESSVVHFTSAAHT